MVPAISGGVSWNILPLDSMSSFLTQTFSPMESHTRSEESQASYLSWVLMSEPPLTLPNCTTWNTTLEGDYDSANMLVTQLLDA